MAKTKPGQQVTEKFGKVVEAGALAVGLLNEIGDRQAEWVRAQNIAQMRRGNDRNGKSMGKYAPRTIKERNKLNIHTTQDTRVTLERHGDAGWQGRIKAYSTSSKVDRVNSTAVINWEIAVDKQDAKKLLGFRSGKYGDKGQAQKRPVVGMADSGTSLRTQQEKQLKRIAKEVYKKELGNDVTFDAKDT